MIECTCWWDVTVSPPEILVADRDCPGHGAARLRQSEVTC